RLGRPGLGLRFHSDRSQCPTTRLQPGEFMTIKAGIVGYGNLGQGVEYLINSLDDFELFGIFSRRDTLDTDAAVYPVDDAAKYKDDIDVMFLCVGSATDIPEQATGFAEHF